MGHKFNEDDEVYCLSLHTMQKEKETSYIAGKDPTSG